MRTTIPTDDKSTRDAIQSLNQTIRLIYECYSYHDGFVIPASIDHVMDKKLFTESIFVHTNVMDFLNHCVIDPSSVSKAMGQRCNIMEQDQNGVRWLINEKKNETIQYGHILDEIHQKDFEYSPGFKFLTKFQEMKDTYTIVWNLDEETKEALINYAVLKVCIGSYQGKDINLVMTKKLFPAIRKAVGISILARPLEEENTFEFVTISCADQWSFYSIHRMINIS